MHQKFPRLSRNRAQETLPFVLLGIAGIAVAHRIRQVTADLSLEDTQAAIDDRMRKLCTGIQQRHNFASRSDDPPAVIVEARAMSALAECYHLAEEQKYQAFAWLGLLYLTERGLVEPNVGRPEVERLRLALKDYGIQILPQVWRPGQTGLGPEYAKARDVAARRKSEYNQRIERIYAGLTSYYYARRLVYAIASDRLSCTLATETGRLTPFIHNPLSARAESIAIRTQQEDDRRAAEEARMDDLGWVSVMLDLDPDNAVGAFFLPPEQSTGRPGRPRDNAVTEKELSEIEGYRGYVLGRLIQEIPGSRVAFKLLRRGKAKQPGPDTDTEASTAKAKVDIRKTERYLVLVTPRGDIVAEFPKSNHATLLIRAESYLDSTHPDFTWEKLLELPVDVLINQYGAVRVEHPHKEGLAADKLGTVEHYVEMLYYMLIEPLEPGQRLPGSERLRRLPRNKRLGTTATRGASS